MMRKKQISRMLIGAFVACMAAACSNETEVLNGLPTDGNTLSVNLRTNDIGAATRTIATDEELEVNNISAYLFDENGTLEKTYKDLTLKESDGKYTVALTHIENRGPKTIYFVANGAGITALNDVEGISEEAFQDLMMNEMTANPETPLAMTAQAELAEWGESVNNAQVTATLERVSARIDLKVDEQAGLTFEPTKIEMAAAANSYIFPNTAVYEGEETVTISGVKLYPYESAAGAVQEVKVTGNVTVGSTTKEGVTFTVPFVNENNEAIAIERNHRYTVHIIRINGFFSVEATVTVSDWSAADASGDLKAGEELKMTATHTVEGADNEAGVAVYPTSETNKDEVEVAVEGDTYRIWVGSANIEAVTSWTELPEGWTIDVPATRSEYLWQKGDWTLTIPANETTEEKSFTIKAVNKLAQAKDPNTEVYVQITFTQKGKEVEEVDHSKNPLLKWAKSDLVYDKDAKKSNFASSYAVQGSLYQWGRNIGWSNYRDAMGGSVETNNGRFWEYATYNRNYKTGTGFYNGEDDQNDYSYDNANDSFSEALYFMNPNSTDYWIGNGGGSTWAEREKACGYTTSVCPEGWRMPIEADFLEIKPSEPKSGSSSLSSVLNNLVELKNIEGVCTYAMRWSAVTQSSKTYLRIDALVVPDNFSADNLSSINWSDENVVTRYFGANGFIHAFYHVNIIQNGTQIDRFPVARPMPGTETHEDEVRQLNYYYYTVLWNYIKDYSVNNEGYYWMSDQKKAFTFQDNTRVKNAQKTANNQPNGVLAFPGRQSVFGTLPIDAQDCCAIRCVTDNPNLQEK